MAGNERSKAYLERKLVGLVLKEAARVPPDNPNDLGARTLESGHAMNNDHAELALDDDTRSQAPECVERVFLWFTEWANELLRYALARQDGAVQPPLRLAQSAT